MKLNHKSLLLMKTNDTVEVDVKCSSDCSAGSTLSGIPGELRKVKFLEDERQKLTLF